MLRLGSSVTWRVRSESLLVVDFSAEWCKPCKAIAPFFERLATQHKGAATFAKVDIDDLPDAFDGVSIPAFHVREIQRAIGSEERRSGYVCYRLHTC